MEQKKNIRFFNFNKEFEKQLDEKVRSLVITYLMKHRELLIENYIAKKFSKFMGENRPLTSEEVMNMLQISRQTLGRRIKAGVLKPINPEAKRNYRFMKSDITDYIERKEVNHG